MSGHTSGSISLDTSGLASEIVRAIGPIMTQINDNMTLLAGLLASTALEASDAVGVLYSSLPRLADGMSTLPELHSVARHIADELARAGYAIVAVDGPAREAAEARAGIDTSLPVPALVPIADPAAVQAAAEDAWFDPSRRD